LVKDWERPNSRTFGKGKIQDSQISRESIVLLILICILVPVSITLLLKRMVQNAEAKAYYLVKNYSGFIISLRDVTKL